MRRLGVATHDKHRREVLRDQDRTEVGKVEKLTLALAAGVLVLAACGIPEDNPGVVDDNRKSAILADPGPSWLPNLGALPSGALSPAIEFGGIAAPSWQPNMEILDAIRTQAEGKAIGNTEPFGHPNYGRVETYLGAEQQTGPR